MRRLKLKNWEVVLVLFAVLLFATSFTFYITDFPLRKYIFGLSSDDDVKIQIGQIIQKQGTLKRQFNGETEYTNLEASAPLYNMDILLTGPESKASIEFENGGSIELGPNTMVKLDFQTEIAFDGISRQGKLNVVAGSVQGQAGKKKILITSRQGTTEILPNTLQKIEVKDSPVRPNSAPIQTRRPKLAQQKNMVSFTAQPQATPIAIIAPPPPPSPTPSPSPSFAFAANAFDPERAQQIKLLFPKKGERLVINHPIIPAAKLVHFEWTMSPPEGKSLLIVRKKGKPVLEQVIDAEGGKARINWKALTPGLYEWEIRDPEGRPITFEKNARSHFLVEKEFTSIKPLPPLVAGVTANSSKLSGDLLTDFDINLRWEPLPQVDEYEITFTSSAHSKKPLMQRITKKPEFRFNKNRIFSGQLYYKVTAHLPTGFIASSGVQKFEFSFAAPTQALPENNSVIALSTLKKENYRLLMTWQKTNFTEGYEIEIGADPEFKQKIVKKGLKENYYIFAKPSPGNYWWRVRSFTKELSSPMSQAYSFKVIP